MTSREKKGAAIVLGLMVLLGALLFATLRRPSGPIGTATDNVLVEQTVINHTKSR